MIRKYILFLKLYLQKPGFYICPVLLTMLILVQHTIIIPDATLTTVGVIAADAYGEQILEDLQQNAQMLSFVRYENVDDLYVDVKNRIIDSGFVIDKNLELKMQQNDCRGLITCISTPDSNKTELAKESVYASFLALYSRCILAQEEIYIYGDEDAQRRSYTEERNRSYLKEGGVFQLSNVELDTNLPKGENLSDEKTLYPVQGMCGLIIVLMSFSCATGTREKKRSQILEGMSRRRAFTTCILEQMACLTALAVVSLILVAKFGQSRGFGVEVVSMLVLVLWSAILHTLLVQIMWNQNRVLAMVIVLTLFQLLICPVYFDLSKYIPAIAWIRLVSPLGIYLGII